MGRGVWSSFKIAGDDQSPCLVVSKRETMRFDVNYNIIADLKISDGKRYLFYIVERVFGVVIDAASG